MHNNIPKIVSEAFPVLTDAMFILQPTPLPDTTFDIFVTNSKYYIALVTTDYADPYDQSRELKNISGSYEFEFGSLKKPFDNKATIEVLPHDQMDGNFFVTAPYKKYKLYYYVANLKSISDK